MRSALVAAGVAVAAVAGVIAAVVVSSGSGGRTAVPAFATTPPATPATTGSTPTTQGAPDATTPRASTGGAPETVAPTPIGATSMPPAAAEAIPTTTASIPPPPPPKSHRRRTFSVGVVDDSLVQQSPAAASTQVEISRRAGFDAAVVSVAWSRGLTKPTAGALRGIANVGAAAHAKHMRLILVVWHGLSRNTPRDGQERAQFATFAAEALKSAPGVHAVIVGNEPNLNTFWMPQFGSRGRDLAAPAYEDLLARTYDALKNAAPRVRVIGGALSPRGGDRPNGIRPTHSPTVFIHDLGAAYRASGRRRPLMDAFAIHPYMVAPWIAPEERHPYTTEITFADYPKLVTLLDEAFRGTAQRGRKLPIVYAEFGVQTVVPDSELWAYTAGTTYDADWGVSAATQAAYYRQALALAYCQPTVEGLFIFHTFDEPGLNGWQSGLYYADRTPKPSLGGFRRAVAALRDGKLTTCGR